MEITTPIFQVYAKRRSSKQKVTRVYLRILLLK
jgi:hypothetical protein